jgi:hypothetical protein
MRTGSTVVRVAPNGEGGWDVREPGNSQPLAQATEEGKAVLRARSLMVNGGVVQILDAEGFLVATQLVPGPRDRPWWYVPPNLFLRWYPAVLVLQGVLGIVDHREDGFELWLYLVVTVVGAAGVVLMVISVRRDRRLARSG